MVHALPAGWSLNITLVNRSDEALLARIVYAMVFRLAH